MKTRPTNQVIECTKYRLKLKESFSSQFKSSHEFHAAYNHLDIHKNGINLFEHFVYTVLTSFIFLCTKYNDGISKHSAFNKVKEIQQQHLEKTKS